MTPTNPAAVSSHLDILRARVAEIRERARKQFAHGAGGGQTATTISDGMRAFVVEQWLEALTIVAPEVAQKLERHSAIVAVGGTGRGELAPFSDIDIMFLHEASVANEFNPVVRRCQHSLYDALLDLGCSVRTPKDAIVMAVDSTVATSLIEMQPLWGSIELVASMKRMFERKVVRSRRRTFFESSSASTIASFGVRTLRPNSSCASYKLC